MNGAINISSEAQAKAILEAVYRVLDAPRPIFVDKSFPAQAAFIKDKAKLKAAQCPRRAGKSRGAGLWLLEPVYEESDVTSLYIAKTRDSAKEIMWRDVLRTIDKDLGLGLVPNHTELTLTNPYNQSVIKLTGADASPDELKKFLGRKLRRVAIDESADFRQNLESLVFEILLPAMADHEGELALIGTAGSILKGLFYEVASGKRPGWSVHKWSAFDNPYMREKIEKQIVELELHNPRIRETPWFRRNYLNEWVPDDSRLVYHYDSERNDIAELPTDLGKALNVIGLDLGFNDASAFTVASYSIYDRNCYFVDCYKKSGMTISDVATRLGHYQNSYDPYAIVVDNASKQAVEELKSRWGFPLIAADKAGKAEFIEIYNSELLAGRIKLLQPAMEPLSTEYQDLIWDEKSSKREEHPACENHASDSALYAWRHCFNHLSKPLSPRVAKTQAQIIDEWEEREAENMAQNKAKPYWERDW